LPAEIKQHDGQLSDDKKRTGSYYTPPDLVNFMCTACIEHHLSDRTGIPLGDFERFLDGETQGNMPSIQVHYAEIDLVLKNMRVIDPAVGSGAFLLGMLDEIVRMRKALNQLREKSQSIDNILHDAVCSLHGVDISTAAVNSTRDLLINLVKRTGHVCNANVVDHFVRNVVAGDALKDAIFPDVMKNRGGFDIVISNPPYLSYYSNTASRLSREERQHLKRAFTTVVKPNDRLNAMNLFLEKGLQLLRPGGTLAYVVNKTLCVLPSYRSTRAFILANAVIDYVVTDLDSFDAVVDCAIIQIAKKSPPGKYSLTWCSFKGEDPDINSLSTTFGRSSDIVDVNEFKHHRMLEFKHSRHDALLGKIERAPAKLRDILNINRGVNIGGCSQYFLARERLDPRYYKIIKDARNIHRYYARWDESQGYFIFDQDREQELRNRGKTLVLGDPRRYRQEKLFIPEASKVLMAAYVPEQIYSAYGILVGTLESGLDDLKYACALLNSRLITFYAIEREILRKGKKATPHVGVKGLNDLPVYLPATVDIQKVVSLIEDVFALTSKLGYPGDTNLEKQGNELMNEIDAFFYQLYGLDSAEIESINEILLSFYK